MPTDAIFLDNDGVLVDTERLYLEATREVLSTVGVSLTDEQYIQLFLIQGIGAWHLLDRNMFSPNDVERFREARNSLYAERLVHEPLLIGGVREVLQTLYGRCRMGVVTSSRRDHFDLIHRRTGLLPYFDFVLTADDVLRVKPHPALYLKAIERSGCDPAACLAVEDSERGLAAAGAAGLRCVIVPTPLTRACTFPRAHRVIASLGEIVSLL